MARSPTERIQELEITVTALQERLGYAEKNNDAAAGAVREAVRAVAELREELVRTVRESERQAADLRQEVALVRQRLDDHLKRVELWDSRRWGLVVAVMLALFGSALSFASGLLLGQPRK